MRKIYFLSLVLLTWLPVTSQIYIGATSYLYANDRVVYSTGNVILNNNFYLRNESQLLQGTVGNSTNSGTGKLSVFQEGTSDNYDYNYWCSPVGDSSGSIGNEPFGITMLHAPVNATSSTPAVMLSMTALDGTASPLAIAPRWIYRFLSSNNYSQWLLTGSASNIAAGEGFTMKGTGGTDATSVDGVQNNSGSAQRYDFRGKPNDGNIVVAVSADNQTLTGNPYPSALHVNAFLLDPGNTACDGIAYYWEQNKAVNSHYLAQYQGGYGTYSPINLASNGIYVPATFDTYDGTGGTATTGTSSGLVINRKYAPIGQGFMVKGLSTGTVTLKNQHRVYYKESGPLSQFEKVSSVNQQSTAAGAISYFRLNADINNQHTRQLALALVPNATDGIDRGIDAESPAPEELLNDIYFPILSKKYVIQGVQFDINKRIPLGVKCVNNVTFKFYIPEVINFNPGQDIYLFDRYTGTYHNIKSAAHQVTLNAGVYNNRFEITFTNPMGKTAATQSQDLDVFQDNDSKMLNVYNPKKLEVQQVSIFDLQGKQIINSTLTGVESSQISTLGINTGIYVVKIKTASDMEVVRKVQILNKR